MAGKSYLTAKEAAEALDISPATLYAYVSRGRIRSREGDSRRRTRLYHAEDVARLVQAREHRKNPKQAVRRALHWGTPLLESGLSQIADNRLHYRGYEVGALAARCSVAAVAHLLWTGDLPADTLRAADPDVEPLSPTCRALAAVLPETLSPVARMQALLPVAAAEDLAAHDLAPDAVRRTGLRLLRLLPAAAAGSATTRACPAAALQAAWLPDAPEAAPALAQALVLVADHGLNVSSFTARCVASARATPYQVTAAGLAALQGARHGLETERFEALLREIGSPDRTDAALARRLARGEPVPGFDHHLYPEGDPRAGYLLRLVADLRPDAPDLAIARAVAARMHEVHGLHPNLDAGLGTLAAVLGLPRGGGVALFAVGRTIGWIGQALEAYAADALIRPRAAYTGPDPRPLPGTAEEPEPQS